MYIVEYSRFTEVEIMDRRVKEGCLYIQMLYSQYTVFLNFHYYLYTKFKGNLFVLYSCS